jgi:hypothetical protein
MVKNKVQSEQLSSRARKVWFREHSNCEPWRKLFGLLNKLILLKTWLEISSECYNNLSHQLVIAWAQDPLKQGGNNQPDLYLSPGVSLWPYKPCLAEFPRGI